MAAPQQKPQSDPWEQAAQAYKTNGSQDMTTAPTSGNDEWKVWQQQDEQPQPLTTRATQAVKNFGVGAAKGLLSTVSSSDDWARQHMPAWMTNSDFGFGPPANLEHVHQMATPHGTAQNLGKDAEQVGEFLVPGGAEEGVTTKLAEYAPKLKPLIRTGTAALASGAVNKAQGGSFGTGAAGGAIGGAVGEGLRAVAPRVAESALNIRKLDRAYGKGGGSIGRAILDETTGFAPGSVAESAQGRLNELNPQLEAAADRVQIPIASLKPARKVLSDASSNAIRQGERTTLGQMQPMAEHLSERIGGTPIQEDVTPRQLLDLKRGFGNEFIHRWNPETMQGVKGTAAQTYHAMGDEFNRAVPGARELNGRISRLIPVAKRAESAELNAPTTQRMFQRIGAPTGALIGPAMGSYEGYRHGGIEGGALGAGIGLLAPTLLTTPTGEMFLARTLNGASRPGTRALAGAALQAIDRKKNNTNSVPR